MSNVILGIVGLLAAGFVFEWVRQSLPVPRQASAAASKSTSRAKAVVLLVIVAFPFSTIMLAKLFDSDVLGWLFGLTLMFGLAMLPCAAIFYIGMKLKSLIGGGRTQSSASAYASPSPFDIQVDRDSVHASDDAPSKRITVQPGSTLRAVLEMAVADAYLPGISGGQATWVVESSGAGSGAALAPIAVCAQQWAKPVFLITAETPIAEHFGGATPNLYFRYRCQDDPDTVLAQLTVTSGPQPSSGNTLSRCSRHIQPGISESRHMRRQVDGCVGLPDTRPATNHRLTGIGLLNIAAAAHASRST